MKLANSILTLSLALSGAAHAAVIYDSIPSPLPPNYPSLGFQATQTAEFGNGVNLAGTARDLGVVTIGMSNWALESTYEPVGATNGFNHPLTVSFYNVGVGGNVGSLIASLTQISFVPWRPEASGSCGTAWLAPNNGCYNGLAFTVDFDFTSLNIVLPDQVIYGVAYNTETWGYRPIGIPGPYNSLNFGLPTTGPTAGSNIDPDGAYWNTSTATNYTDGGAGGIGIFRKDTAWAPYAGAITINASGVPEPGTCLLALTGLSGLITVRIRKRTRA
jgi:hypothetical protein